MPVKLHLSRAQLRTRLRKQRRNLSQSLQAQAAQSLFRQLAQHPLFLRAQHIALYSASDGEIDPQLLMREAWRRGKHVYLPVLARWPKTTMYFSAYVQLSNSGKRIASALCSRVGASLISAQFGRWMQCFYLWWVLINMANV